MTEQRTEAIEQTALKVKEATSEDAVKAVLACCARVRDMVSVYQAVTGEEYTGRIIGVRRADIETMMARQIMAERENASFHALSTEEKYSELKAQSDVTEKLHGCTMEELKALADIAGLTPEKSASEKREKLEKRLTDKMNIERLEELVSEEAGTSEIYSVISHMSREALNEVALSAGIVAEGEYHSAWVLSEDVMRHIRAKIAMRTFFALKEAGSKEAVREILKKADSPTVCEVAKKAGSDFEERCAEAREEIGNPEQLQEWGIEWIMERLGIEEGVETKMAEERQPESETAAEIAFPLEGHTAESVKNLVNTLYSRGKLMSKATGGDFRVSEKLVEELKEYGSTKEEVLRIIRSAGEDWLHGLAFEEDKVVFTGFPATEDGVKSHAYILLARAINQTSMEQKRIQAKTVDESNEKFAFRVWLVRLGLNGPERKAERKTFYVNLTGHTAFRTKADEGKWYARRKAAASTRNTQAEE